VFPEVVVVAVFVLDVGFEVRVVLLRIVLLCLLVDHIVAAVGLPFVDAEVETVVHKRKAFVAPLIAANIAVTETSDILQLLAVRIVDKPLVVVFVGTAVDKVVAHIFGMAVEIVVVC
jgi:hypothetical protein